MKKERFTLPGESGLEKEIEKLVELWGVDAIRDSDGTTLSKELINMGLKVYSTICLVRMDNEFAKKHKEYLQQIFLSSDCHVAMGDTLRISVMENVYKEQFEPNVDVDVNKYWQVMNRTTGNPIPTADWTYSDGIVTIHKPQKWHKYSVNFLARQIWEPVSMYNHLLNNWDEEHKMPIDPIHSQVRVHILKKLEEWLNAHPKTDIVRFTTFFYCFDLVYDKNGKEKMVNWFGYLACVSPLALELFEREYGYTLTPEDFIDNFRYNTPFKNPTKKYLDWMDFIGKFVCGFAKECVSLVHKYNKKAIMFLGDHWAGTEPYGKYFQSIGLDAIVGAAGDGVTTRMIADVPVAETEARLYPYLFPDIFCEGGDPVGISVPIWTKCRRAILRKPIARIGYGGYLSLALKFPVFIEHVTKIKEQFNSIWDQVDGELPLLAPFKVAILSSWGKIRSWQTHQVAHSLWNQRCYSYLGVLEALAGLPFEVEFISFHDIRTKGIPKDIGVILNAGDAYTAWSGGDNWADQRIVTAMRQWVARGGGFIGIGEPTAVEQKGEFFALSDVLGVQKEIGFTASNNKPKIEDNSNIQGEPGIAQHVTGVECKHFITADIKGEIDYGEGMSMIFKAVDTVRVLDYSNMTCKLTTNTYGKGRSVYIAGLPYSAQNSRLLHRTICWVANSEAEFNKNALNNVNVEFYCYPNKNKVCIVNNSSTKQEVSLILHGKNIDLELEALQMVWL